MIADRTGWERCVVLREGSGGTAIFPHGIFGVPAHTQNAVVQAVPAAWQILTLSIDSPDRAEAIDCFAEMVEGHVQNLLRAELPTPVVFYGYSYAGMLAWDIACRLDESGADVDLVVLGDTLPEPVHQSITPRQGWELRWFQGRRALPILRYRFWRMVRRIRQQIRPDVQATKAPDLESPEFQRVKSALRSIDPPWTPQPGAVDVAIISTEGLVGLQREHWEKATTGSVSIRELRAAHHLDLASRRTADAAVMFKAFLKDADLT